MSHLSQKELIEQYYSKESTGVGLHIEDCAECAAVYAELESDLDEMQFSDPPARDAGYGERVWQSLSGSLPAYERRKRNWLGIGMMRGLSFATACGLLVAGAFYAGIIWEQKHQQPTTTAVNTSPSAPAQEHPAPPKERIVVVVLSDHLDRSERLLVQLKHADAGSEEMLSPLRDEARSLLAANRICQQNMKQGDDPALATALDRLDHLLAQLANRQGGLDAEALSQLQDEMKSDSLLFEVRVLRSRIPDRRPAMSDRSEGGTI
jgi:hypothetical protein